MEVRASWWRIQVCRKTGISHVCNCAGANRWTALRGEKSWSGPQQTAVTHSMTDWLTVVRSVGQSWLSPDFTMFMEYCCVSSVRVFVGCTYLHIYMSVARTGTHTCLLHVPAHIHVGCTYLHIYMSIARTCTHTYLLHVPAHIHVSTSHTDMFSVQCPTYTKPLSANPERRTTHHALT
jgi:hypothetical protein